MRMCPHPILNVLISFASINLLLNTHAIYSEESVNAKTKAVRDYLTMCPHTPTCTREILFVPFPLCCSHCSCEDTCGFDCCSDGTQEYMTLEDIETLKANDIIKCLKPSVKSNMFSDNWSFYEMIAGCPPDFDDVGIEEKCLESYEHFNLGNQMWNVPVTVNSTRKTYKNVFCALCNGVAVQDGVIWETILRCLSLPFQYERSYLSELNISSVNDIPDKVPEMFCNVLFQTPILPGTNTRIQGTKQCSGVIDRCNVTGQWKGEPFPYDYHMESACLSYKSEYKGYRNIHCYLCNGGNTSGIETECYPSFSAFSTRDFTLVVRNPISKDNQTCNSDCVFDSSTNTCRRLHCSRGFVFDDRQCVPFLQPDTAVSYYYVYDVMLTFEPDTSSLTKAVTTWWIQSLITKTTSDVNIKLRRPGETDYFSTCDVRSYIKYKHTINELSDTLKREVREILFFDVMYFAVSFRISITNITNMFKKIGELEALYNFTNVEIYGHLMKGRSRTIDPVLLGKVNGHDEIARLNRSVGEPMVDSDLVKSLGLETYMEDTLLNSVTDDSDGLAMSTLPYNYNTNNDRNNLICDSIAVINKDVFCPKIELKSGEFSLDRDRLRIKSLGRYISKDIGHFDSGWATVLICNHTYMDLVSRGPVSGGRLVRVSLEIMFSTIFVIFWPDISVI